MPSTNQIIARFQSHGKTFEFFVDSDKIQDYKQGKIVNPEEVVIATGVFTDLRKTLRATESDLKAVFGTNDFREIAKQILDKGEIQLTVDQRRAMTEQKMNKIITYISKRAVDPKTGNPHPPLRIQTGLDQVKFRIDPFLPAEAQVKEAIDKLKTVLPLSIESKKVELKIPINFAGACKRIIESEGTITKDQWLGNYWIANVEIPAGMVNPLFDRLNSITHGQLVADVLK